ncbi:MAG: T9SS type A sorting domain-containing protein [Ignavibacteria bacterium]|nr:T9SS type A sorting domain-containing protein [Ignavibacteria bacterium]
MFPSGKIIGSDTDSGLYVIKTNFTMTGTGNNLNASIPSDYNLSQNYPNPFNPNTNINFSIPKNSLVNLDVFNSAGQKVANLVNDRRDAGNYEISFDGSRYGLSSGTYFYRLQSEGFSETKRMILLK